MKGKQIVKVLAAWLLYVTLHFAYKIYPCGITKFLGCPEETLYVHMKMAFFSYLIINIVFSLAEVRKGIKPNVPALMLSNCVYPYLAFFIWLAIPALTGMMDSVAAEIAYSNIILIICLLITVNLEQAFEQIKWFGGAKIAVIVLFVLSAFLFTVMTLKTPDIGFFSSHGHETESAEEHRSH